MQIYYFKACGGGEKNTEFSFTAKAYAASSQAINSEKLTLVFSLDDKAADIFRGIFKL